MEKLPQYQQKAHSLSKSMGEIHSRVLTLQVHYARVDAYSPTESVLVQPFEKQSSTYPWTVWLIVRAHNSSFNQKRVLRLRPTIPASTPYSETGRFAYRVIYKGLVIRPSDRCTELLFN